MSKRSGGEWPSEALIEKLIAYLDDPNDKAGVWRGLRFMEENGLDFGLRAGELNAYLTDPDFSPIENPQDLTHEQVRTLILALRDVVRNDLGLPPLTGEERQAWDFELVPPLQWRPDQMVGKAWGETYHPTPDEIAELKAKFIDEAPELSRALALFTAYNALHDDLNDIRQSLMWSYYPMIKFIARARPDLDASGVHNAERLVLDSFKPRNN